MIDDSDVELAAMTWPSSGCFSTVIGIIVVCVLAYFACQNDEECAKKSCPSGQTPKLMQHECLCVERAK